MSAVSTHHDLKKLKGHADRRRNGIAVMAAKIALLANTAKSSPHVLDIECAQLRTPNGKQSSPTATSIARKLN